MLRSPVGTVNTGPVALIAASAPETIGSVAPMTNEQLAPVVANAKQLWTSTGILDRDQLLRLASAHVEIVNLDGLTLGLTDENIGIVVIDADAAGWGWGEGGIDLLTVVTHELGHVVGFAHEDHGVMEPTLDPGTRLVLDTTGHR